MASIAKQIKRDIKKQLDDDKKNLETGLAVKGRDYAERVLSSGMATSKQLAREDHPYAKRHGDPRRDPGIINDQGGMFKKSWKIKKGTGFWRGVPVIVNESKVAKYLQPGTKHMFARPLEAKVIQFVRTLTPSRMRELSQRKKEIKP